MVALSCKFTPFPPVDFPPGPPNPLTKGLDQLNVQLTFPPGNGVIIPPVPFPPSLSSPLTKGLSGFSYTPTFPPNSPPKEFPPVPIPPPLPIPKVKKPPLLELKRFCPIDGETTVG